MKNDIFQAISATCIQRILIYIALLAYMVFENIDTYYNNQDEEQVLVYKYFSLFILFVGILLFGIAAYSAGIKSVVSGRQHEFIAQKNFLANPIWNHFLCFLAFVLMFMIYAFTEDTIHNRVKEWSKDKTINDTVIDFEDITVSIEIMSTITLFGCIILMILYIVSMTKENDLFPSKLSNKLSSKYNSKIFNKNVNE